MTNDDVGGGEDDLTCVTAGCTHDVPNGERCTPCENAYFDGVQTGVESEADEELKARIKGLQNQLKTEKSGGVRGREEIDEKLEEVTEEPEDVNIDGFITKRFDEVLWEIEVIRQCYESEDKELPEKYEEDYEALSRAKDLVLGGRDEL